MTRVLWIFTAVSFFILPTIISAQKGNKPMTGSAAKGAESAGMQVVPDLDQRLAKFRRVEMPFHSAGLTAREVKMVEKLVDASRYLEEIYWRQIDPDALTLYESLAGSKNPKDEMLRRYLWINASRFDLLDDNKPFVGTTPMSPGRGFYPQNLTREQVEQYVKAHPEKKDEIYSSFTVVRWHGDQLEGLPYHIAYRSFLEPAAKDLREAASLSDDPAFANFLRLRADALLSDDYFKSNLAWLDLKNPKFDVAFAPDETYDDGLLGVKATYGAAVMIRNVEESRKLEMFQKYVADIQDALPLAPEDRPSKRGLETPMEVMDTPFRAGDLNHGYQAVADNLPNDPRVHEQKGSKKLFFKNFMDARVNYVVLPVAQTCNVAGAGREGIERRLPAGDDHARDCARAGAGVLADGRRQGGHSRIHRANFQRSRRSQGGRRRIVWFEVAGRPRRPAQEQAGRILRIVCCGNFSHGSLRCRRGSRTGGNDGVQLPL